jgi:hypothetical protein
MTTWGLTKKGYLRGKVDGRQKMQHVVVWERAHGPKPEGFNLHHVNGDKQDNALDNLLLVDPTTHKRIHSGCELRDGEWWKPCHACGEMKPISTGYYMRNREGQHPLSGECRACTVRRVVAAKQARRARARAAA